MLVINGIEYLTLEETAKIVGCSEVTVRIRSRAKEMPTPIKLPAHVFWPKKEVEEYVEATKKKENEDK